MEVIHMSKIMNLINYKKIIREDRERHVDTMNELIDQLKDSDVPKETREELAETAKGMLATNTVLEDTNCRIYDKVGSVKGMFDAVALGVIGYGIGKVVGHLIAKRK
jgi:division protein CdvB (Snf7/Vps24/ESCRT-III family)